MINLVIGGKYNFRNQPERLVYLGQIYDPTGYWHQFTKVGETTVWCEIRNSDLHMIEETL